LAFLYRNIVRPVLFLQDSETIHNRTLRILAIAARQKFLRGLTKAIYGAPEKPVEVFGLNFPNPIGLAAGMDKFAAALPIWECLGFGFTELGGVTWRAQPGNDGKRMFRIIPDRALINRMGFNNQGAEAMARTLASWKNSGCWPKHPVGMNLGKSKITPLEKAAEDYANSFRLLRDHVDFFVVNVSSPNTPNLRQLQDKSALDEILVALQQINTARKPILVKIAPDLSFEAIDEILQLAQQRQLAGIVATNTTIARPQSSNPTYSETGGLSGAPLRQRSTEIIRHIHKQTAGKLPIIGVGGIFTAADAREKLEAGASLLQIYTSLVYEGPAVVKTIVSGLS
jgi:dihydroorotate dehydrogenase